MRFSLSVVNGATGVRRDVLVDADPGDRGGGAAAACSSTRPTARCTPVSRSRSRCGSTASRSRRTDSLRRPRVVQPGSVVALHEPDGYDAALPRGVVELRVVSGPGAGRIHRFGIGEHQIGNGASGMSLPDLFLPTDALVIRVTSDAEVEIVERNRAVLLDGRDPSEPDPEHDEEDAAAVELLPMEALTRRERTRRKKSQRRDRRADRKAEKRRARPRKGVQTEDEPEEELGDVAWPEGADLRIGESLLQWHRVWMPDADAGPSDEVLGIDFNRPPRLLRPERETSFVLAERADQAAATDHPVAGRLRADDDGGADVPALRELAVPAVRADVPGPRALQLHLPAQGRGRRVPPTDDRVPRGHDLRAPPARTRPAAVPRGPPTRPPRPGPGAARCASGPDSSCGCGVVPIPTTSSSGSG